MHSLAKVRSRIIWNCHYSAIAGRLFPFSERGGKNSVFGTPVKIMSSSPERRHENISVSRTPVYPCGFQPGALDYYFGLEI
jgi:hypothetical protein